MLYLAKIFHEIHSKLTFILEVLLRRFIRRETWFRTEKLILTAHLHSLQLTQCRKNERGVGAGAWLNLISSIFLSFENIFDTSPMI